MPVSADHMGHTTEHAPAMQRELKGQLLRSMYSMGVLQSSVERHASAVAWVAVSGTTGADAFGTAHPASTRMGRAKSRMRGVCIMRRIVLHHTQPYRVLLSGVRQISYCAKCLSLPEGPTPVLLCFLSTCGKGRELLSPFPSIFTSRSRDSSITSFTSAGSL